MSVVLITGDHPRHKYLADRVAEAGLLSGWIIEQRAAFVPEPLAGLDNHLADLFRLHFRRREEAEEAFFGSPSLLGDVNSLHVTPDSLNDAATHDFIQKAAPGLVISYGCHKLSDALIENTSATFWNTHGGLSPQYRGVITHFWPSYLLEPHMTGVTLHETTSHIDGGAVIHQTAAMDLVSSDGLHDLAGRTVKAYSDELPQLLKSVIDAPLPQGLAQKTTGKIWTSWDWRPEHLRLIYDVYEDRICRAANDGEIEGRKPKCVSVLRA